MKPSAEALADVHSLQNLCLAHQVFAQLPTDREDAAAVLAHVLRFAEEAGLLPPARSQPVLVSLSGGNSPSRRAKPTDKSPIEAK
jgi:hypothetical protein